jgi:hypothetical protein
MSRKRSKGGGERYVGLTHYLLACPAWKTMHSDAKALLIDVWMRYNGINNGEISYAVSEAAGIGLSKAQAARMFLMLIERGFLAVVRNSDFNVKIQVARTWRITAVSRGDQNATKDFIRWSPAKPNAEPARPKVRPAKSIWAETPTAQNRRRIAELLDQDPYRSDRAIAKLAGTSNHTVAAVRAQIAKIRLESAEADPDVRVNGGQFGGQNSFHGLTRETNGLTCETAHPKIAQTVSPVKP